MLSPTPGNAPPRRRLGRHKGPVLVWGLAVVISMGLVYLAIDYERARPTPPADEPEQVCTMPDGTLLVLRKVTFGKQHHCDVRYRTGGPSSAARTRYGSTSTTTRNDAIVVWLSRRDAVTGQALDFDWWSHCVAVDDHGCEMPDEQPGRHAFHAIGSSGESGSRPFGPLASQSSQKYEEIVVHSAVRPFRHQRDSFTLRVYDRKGAKVAEFDVRDPNPNRSRYPTWEPEPLPATKQYRNLSVTLNRLTGTMGERAIVLKADLTVTQDGKPAPAGTINQMRVLDAAGNVDSPGDCRLCPHETAWKLQVRLARNENAPFDPSEEVALAGVAVPTPWNVRLLHQRQTVQGVTVEPLAVGGAGKVAHFGLATGFSGSVGSSGSVGGGAKRYPCRVQTEARRGTGSTTTVECELPHVVARVTGLTEDHHPPALRVTDDRGRNVKVHGFGTHAGEIHFWFLEMPPAARTLDLKFIIQKGMVEFLVKPPPVGPLKARVQKNQPK